MYETTYHRPSTLSEALKLFSVGVEARYLSGGMTLIPTMKQRLAAPSDVIDLGRLPELKGIEIGAETVSIGAAVTHAEIAASAEIRRVLPALASLANRIGDPHVRHRGTIGGSVANNDPAADYPAALLALDATVVTTTRSLPAAEFFQGLFTTALEEGEIVTRIVFHVPEKAAYAKFPNPASRYAMAGVFVARLRNGHVHVAVTGAGQDGVFRAEEMERALQSRFAPAALDAIAVDPSNLLSDIHASAIYRANLVKVMAKRAVAEIA